MYGENLNCNGCDIMDECSGVYPFALCKEKGVETSPPCGANLIAAIGLLRRWIGGTSGDGMHTDTRDALKLETEEFIESAVVKFPIVDSGKIEGGLQAASFDKEEYKPEIISGVFTKEGMQ